MIFRHWRSGLHRAVAPGAEHKQGKLLPLSKDGAEDFQATGLAGGMQVALPWIDKTEMVLPKTGGVQEGIVLERRLYRGLQKCQRVPSLQLSSTRLMCKKVTWEWGKNPTGAEGTVPEAHTDWIPWSPTSQSGLSCSIRESTQKVTDVIPGLKAVLILPEKLKHDLQKF